MAIQFDGTDDYINIPSVVNIPTGATSRTIAFWVNILAWPNGTNSSVFAIGNSGVGGKYIILLAQIGGIIYLFTDNANAGNNITLSGTEIPNLNVWNHIAFSLDNSTSWKYYLNGVLTKSGTFGTAINTSATDMAMGRRSVGATGYATVILEDIMIYNRALTDIEVSILGKSRMKFGSIKSGLVGYWPLDDNLNNASVDGKRVIDRSENGNHGLGIDGANNAGLTSVAGATLSYF